MDKALVSSTVDKLKSIADILYKGELLNGQSKLGEVIGALATISDSIEAEDVKKRWTEDALMPLLEAMEDKDATGMADIITYEVISVLEEF